MSLSLRQQTILADIGIPVWERREAKHAVQISPAVGIQETFTEDSAVAELKLKGKIVVVVQSMLSSSENTLLQAMLKSIALTPEQVDLLDEKQFSQVSTLSLNDKTVWLLGNILTSDNMADMDLDRPQLSSVNGNRQIACHSLDAMLNEPRLKASAWQALQQLAKTF